MDTRRLETCNMAAMAVVTGCEKNTCVFRKQILVKYYSLAASTIYGHIDQFGVSTARDMAYIYTYSRSYGNTQTTVNPENQKFQAR